MLTSAVRCGADNGPDTGEAGMTRHAGHNNKTLVFSLQYNCFRRDGIHSSEVAPPPRCPKKEAQAHISTEKGRSQLFLSTSKTFNFLNHDERKVAKATLSNAPATRHEKSGQARSHTK